MAITFREDDGIGILTLTSRVVAQGSREFREHLEKLIAHESRLKVIDVTAVEFIDSHALGLILYYCAGRENDGYKLYVVNASGSGNSYIDKLLQLTDLHLAVRIVSDISDIKDGKDN